MYICDESNANSLQSRIDIVWLLCRRVYENSNLDIKVDFIENLRFV